MQKNMNTVPDSIRHKKKHLLTVIVPQIDRQLRRGRKKSQEEIRHKLVAECGELLVELETLRPRARLKKIAPRHLGIVGGEVADVLYYALQLNDGDDIVAAVLEMGRQLGVAKNACLGCCLVKYRMRAELDCKNGEMETLQLEQYLRGQRSYAQDIPRAMVLLRKITREQQRLMAKTQPGSQQ